MKSDNKLLWTERLDDGTKIFHYLKRSGDMTLRIEIPKKVVPSFLASKQVDFSRQDIQTDFDVSLIHQSEG